MVVGAGPLSDDLLRAGSVAWLATMGDDLIRGTVALEWLWWQRPGIASLDAIQPYS